VLTDEEMARQAGLDASRHQAILGACRDAISDMRAALFDLRQHRDKARQAATRYLKNAIACEKTFALSPISSKLRGQGGSDGQASPPASDGPLRITPRAQRRLA
jgi:hypothetical protein